MNLSVRILHFTDGIPQLRGAMSVSAGYVEGGPKAMESIKRIPGGYLVGCDRKLFVVSDSQVKCAEVTDIDAAGGFEPVAVPVGIDSAAALEQALAAARGPAQVGNEVEARSKAENAPAYRPKFPLGTKVGDIVSNSLGQMQRVTAADLGEGPAAVSEDGHDGHLREPEPAAVTQFKPPKRRRGPTPVAR